MPSMSAILLCLLFLGSLVYFIDRLVRYRRAKQRHQTEPDTDMMTHKLLLILSALLLVIALAVAIVTFLALGSPMPTENAPSLMDVLAIVFPYLLILLLIGTIFLANPITALILFIRCLARYRSAKSTREKDPAALSREEMSSCTMRLILSAAFFAVVSIAFVCIFLLPGGGLSYM